MDNTQIKELDDDELFGIIEQAQRELNRRAVIRDARAEAEVAADRYREAVKDEPAREWHDGDIAGPGDKVVEDGVEFVNTSRTWLSVPPSAYPLGYERCQTPQDVEPFEAGEDVEAGDLRDYNGTVYEVLQAHTTADHWTPDVAHSLWTTA